MSITQTVKIPASHKLTIDVPPEVPAGSTAWVELKVLPFVKKEEKPASSLKSLPGVETPIADSLLGVAANNNGKLRLSKQELDEMLRNAQTPISDSLTGILEHLGDITIEQIREERLAKYSV